VNQSTRELGIRMALGASAQAVLTMVMRQGALVAVAGLAAGAAGAWALTRLMRTMLFGIEHTDPLTFFTVGGLLAIVAIAATVGPARRAARVDPTIAMRAE
jgi:ABC-type antimicrobial peptide transport system permease subunit